MPLMEGWGLSEILGPKKKTLAEALAPSPAPAPQRGIFGRIKDNFGEVFNPTSEYDPSEEARLNSYLAQSMDPNLHPAARMGAGLVAALTKRQRGNQTEKRSELENAMANQNREAYSSLAQAVAANRDSGIPLPAEALAHLYQNPDLMEMVQSQLKRFAANRQQGWENQRTLDEATEDKRRYDQDFEHDAEQDAWKRGHEEDKLAHTQSQAVLKNLNNVWTNEAGDSVPAPQTPEEQQALLEGGYGPMQKAGPTINNMLGSGTNIKGETDLRKEYSQASQDFKKVQEGYRKVKTLAARGSAVSDHALIFSYMKTQDPDSVVRESEFDIAQSLGSLPQRLHAAALKVHSGQRLTPEQRQAFVTASKDLYDAALQTQRQLRKQYEEVSKAYGYDPQRSLLEYMDPGLSEKTVTLQAPTGEVMDVPEAQAAHYESLGAKRVR